MKKRDTETDLLILSLIFNLILVLQNIIILCLQVKN